jgi:hypothetical protein
MKLGFVIPFVGPAVSSAAGLSAFCRALDLDQLLDVASQVIARWSGEP